MSLLYGFGQSGAGGLTTGVFLSDVLCETQGIQYRKHQAPPIAAGSSPQNTAKVLNTSLPEFSGDDASEVQAKPRASNATPATWSKNTPIPIASNQLIRGIAPIPTAASTSTAIKISP